MENKKLTPWFVVATVCLLVLSGCRDNSEELDNVISENKQLKAELREVQLQRAKVQKDNEQLKKNIDELFADLESMEAKFEIVLQAKGRAQTDAIKSMARQVNEQAQRDVLEMSGQRETAVLQVKELKRELDHLRQLLVEKDALIAELDSWIDQVQANTAESDIVLETWESDPNVVLEEMTDEDNV